MKLKSGLALAIILLSVGVAGADIKLSKIAKSPDGSIQTMDQYKAMEYCSKHKMRLPTAREWASHSQSLGAKGILRTRYANVSESDQSVITERDRMRGKGYYPVYRLNSTKQTVVDFYFNEVGYHRPTGPQSDYFFWSSSVHPIDLSEAYGFHSSSGDIGKASRKDYHYGAVGCLKN